MATTFQQRELQGKKRQLPQTSGYSVTGAAHGGLCRQSTGQLLRRMSAKSGFASMLCGTLPNTSPSSQPALVPQPEAEEGTACSSPLFPLARIAAVNQLEGPALL